MAIQIPNPGTGNGATGDNEYVLWSKVKDNFSDQSNAASRLVGDTGSNIVEAKKAHKAASTHIDAYYPKDSAVNCNDFEQGSIYLVRSSGNINTPPDSTTSTDFTIETRRSYHGGTHIQIAWGYNYPEIFTRTYWSADDGWSPWVASCNNVTTYKTTTAAGANVVVDNTGKLMRSTSSERYKNIITDLELDDEMYANAMQLAPIIYRSTADADNPDYHYYSFSAEALGAYDPAFTLWRETETETVTDADGNVTEQPLDERVAEGINLNAIVAFLHATNIKQGKLIADLEQRLSVLEPTPEA